MYDRRRRFLLDWGSQQRSLERRGILGLRVGDVKLHRIPLERIRGDEVEGLGGKVVGKVRTARSARCRSHHDMPCWQW